MKRQKVKSSNIYSIGYDVQSQILEIEFHNGGIYQYFSVPSMIFSNLISASSHGSYFHHYIKDEYRYTKIK